MHMDSVMICIRIYPEMEVPSIVVERSSARRIGAISIFLQRQRQPEPR
jgi:hypothetical protein